MRITRTTITLSLAPLLRAAKPLGRWLLRHRAEITRHAVFCGGLAALCVGLWWERPSLALIVPGTLFVLGTIWSWINAQHDLQSEAGE